MIKAIQSLLRRKLWGPVIVGSALLLALIVLIQLWRLIKWAVLFGVIYLAYRVLSRRTQSHRARASVRTRREDG